MAAAHGRLATEAAEAAAHVGEARVGTAAITNTAL